MMYLRKNCGQDKTLLTLKIHKIDRVNKMRQTLRNKLNVSFLMVIAICNIFATLVGVRLIGDGIVRQAQDKVRVDLNSARGIYQERLNNLKDIVRLTATRFFLKQSLIGRNRVIMETELKKVLEEEALDILTLTDARGRVIFRTRNPETFGDDQSDSEIVRRVLSEKTTEASTEIISRDNLLKEGEDLADRAYFKFISTPKAKPRAMAEETFGMIMKAAAPIYDDNHLLGVLYGSVLLNRQYDIVDKIKETVYQGEIYKGKDIGTATLFQGDLRISTNVQREDGTRAIGTRVSAEVFNQVLVKGLPWISRAFVVNNWYITAYEPIKNITGDIIGILYVGILEDKFTDMRRTAILIFLGIALAGVIAAFIVSYFLANGILKPIQRLVFASEKLAQGDLSFRVELDSKDEIGELAKTFNLMAESLKDRDEKLKKHAQQKIMESERLATIGQLAAGVAHEINNPLGGILIYSHLLLENLDENDPQRENLEKIVTQATRCKGIVKGLLDFSHQTEPKIVLVDGNELLSKALSLLENQTIFQNINIVKDLSSSSLPAMADGAQIQQVFINIILNAAEAMGGKGDLHIFSRMTEDKAYAEYVIRDTGCGISEENIERLFEPFFTTKEVGHGTGLGLAISYGIVQRHKGTIVVESQVGKGTSFTIRLPIAKEKK